jgi:hypothetical protein
MRLKYFLVRAGAPRWWAIASLLWAGALAPAQDGSSGAGKSPGGLSRQVEELSPLQLDVKAKTTAALQKADQAAAARREAEAAKTAWEKAQADLRRAMQPPPPGASSAELRRRDERIGELGQVERQRRGDVSEKTLNSVQVEKEAQRAVAELKQLVSDHPDVTLPPSLDVMKRLRSLNLTPDGNKALQQLKEVHGDLSRYDTRPGTGRSGGTLPDTGGKAADPRLEREMRALKTEADSINTEAARIINWRKTLEGKFEDLKLRIRDHNAHSPTRPEDVGDYNARAARLNGEKSELEEEARRFDRARLQLRDRISEYQKREKDSRK